MSAISQLAIHTNIKIAQYGATVVGSVMALSALEPFVAALQAERGSAHSTQKQLLSSSFSDYSSIRKLLLTCLNFQDFSLQQLNNPLN